MKYSRILLAMTTMVLSTAASAACDHEITEIAATYGSRSDSPSSPVLAGTLLAGDIHKGAQGQIGPFNQDVYLYINNGSFHSGWFQEAFALDLECKLKGYTLLYSE
ncbi:hypothetical protein Bb109J_c1223 [Bdellovibrio bacteriovorus]|uniref:hypothetical protein n=1 Tax=Bdellovibrio bacteriovorus TaxID=959 RepID=UPI00045BF0AF|nr:hypothetical protein [Bdellovibrio bacteriovorus]AHZ86558.1 hypothetical protein EP01_16685 [Bdellovibrio bacteriovorus]BEV67803.1 hypothetical protein Bb109J_c1223 [Bdellovibrio bacteriovorus]